MSSENLKFNYLRIQQIYRKNIPGIDPSVTNMLWNIIDANDEEELGNYYFWDIIEGEKSPINMDLKLTIKRLKDVDGYSMMSEKDNKNPNLYLRTEFSLAKYPTEEYLKRVLSRNTYTLPEDSPLRIKYKNLLEEIKTTENEYCDIPKEYLE